LYTDVDLWNSISKEGVDYTRKRCSEEVVSRMLSDACQATLIVPRQRPALKVSSTPKVSVIIPNYDHGRFLEKRIRSVLDQSFEDLEVIFLDDASTDDSREVFAQFAADPRICAIWNKENSGGTFKQWNKGFREAKGEYVWIAESDDYADERFLEVMLSRFEQHPSAGLVCCRPMVVDDQDRILGPFNVNGWWVMKNNRPLEDYFNKGRDECAHYMVISDTIPNVSGVLIKRSVLEAAGYADESMRIAADYLFMAKILLISDIAFVVEPLNYWRWHPGTVRASEYRSGVALAESYRVVKFIADRVDVDPSTLSLSIDFWYNRWRELSAESGGFSLSTNRQIYRAARAVDPRITRKITRWIAGKIARKLGVLKP
jgi:glycosyltransferase involved in cell wall biosynthesis